MVAGGQTPVSCEASMLFRLPSHLSGPSRGFCEVVLSDQAFPLAGPSGCISRNVGSRDLPCPDLPKSTRSCLLLHPLLASLSDCNGARVLRRTSDRATGALRTAFQPTQMSKAYTREAWGEREDQLLSLGGVFKRWDQHSEKCMVT